MKRAINRKGLISDSIFTNVFQPSNMVAFDSGPKAGAKEEHSTMKALRINMIFNIVAFALGVALVVLAYTNNLDLKNLGALAGVAIIVLALAAYGK